MCSSETRLSSAQDHYHLENTVTCGAKVVAKVVWGAEDFTEYTTLQYLQQNKTNIPASRPLGLLRVRPVSVLFMSYFPGKTLEDAWPSLSTDQKASVQDQLRAIFDNLRTLRLSSGKPLGGVAGKGCKDARRHLRRIEGPIFNVEEYFQFSDARYGSPELVNYLRAFQAQDSYQVVFTHGDLRLANVIVNLAEGTGCIVVGIIDWEDSGFSPEYYEATKATNCLATDIHSDWYSFLPPCILPHSYKLEWLRDYVLGRHLG